jgi:hypothetical protein
MLHKLALATSADIPSFLKEAIGPQDEIAKRLAQREIDYAVQRGIDIPLKVRMGADGIEELVPDMENLRLNKRKLPETGMAEGVVPATKATKIDPATGKAVLEDVADAGKAVKKEHVIPGASKPADVPYLAERETFKAHSDVANSRLKQMRHKYYGGAKRFLGGKGLFGNKWGNRAAALGGLGLVGAGIKAYMDSNQEIPVPQTTAIAPTQQYPTYMQAMHPQQIPQQMYGGYAQQQPQQMYGGYAPYGYQKTGSSKYSPDAVTIPKPTAQPTVKALGPGVSSAPKLTGTRGRNFGGSMTSSNSLGGTSTNSGSSDKKASDAGMLPLLGAAAGGAGGWALGEKFLKPTLEKQEQVLVAEIAKKQQQLDMLKKTTNKAGVGAAAAGAILLAALASLYSKKKTERKQGVRQLQQQYDNTHAGFHPRQQYDPYGQFYG